MVVHYFTKWVVAQALANFTNANILRFFKRNILAMYKIPYLIMSENGT